MFSKQDRPLSFLPELDGLRGISVLLVLFFHLDRRYFPGCHFLYDDLKLGKLGVSLFFLLSGYLITRILLFIPPNFASLKTFWIRRFLRIFPIYYLTVFLVYSFSPGPYLGSSLIYLVNFTNVTYSMWAPLNHTWSLAVEEHFYLVWPLLFLAWPKKSQVLSIVLIVFSIGTALLTMSFFPKEIARKLISEGSHVQIFCLCIGAWLAHYRIARATSVKIISVLMTLLFTAIALLADWGNWGFHKYLYRHLAGSLLATGIFLFTLASCQKSDSWAIILRLRPIQEIGKKSYGIYLYHLPIYFLFNILDGGTSVSVKPYWVAGLAMLTVWMTAYLSFRYIEYPIIQLKDRFPYPIFD